MPRGERVARARRSAERAGARAAQLTPPGRVRLTRGMIKQALRASGGFVTYAARRLNVHPNTIWNHMKKYPDLAEEVNAIRESHLDLAESSLLSQVNDKNTQATIFFLECQGKKRGYIRNPAVNLHAHVEAGSGTWADIMKRVANECGGQVNATSVIDVTPVKKALPKSKTDDDDDACE